MNIIETFLNNLPKKPYATDDLTYGIKINTQAAAIRKKYLQQNHPDWLTCLVFDVDCRAYEILEDTHAKPNLAVFNGQKRDSAHFIYMLESPINTGKNGRLKPIRYAQAVENSLIHHLQADPNYVGLLTKNPNHQDHITHQTNTQPWTLDHLADYIDLSKTKQQREVAAHSRNCRMFDLIRFKAYDIIDEYRKSNAFELFSRTLMAYAEEKNHFPNLPPLPFSSIKATVKSVSKWTWSNYTGDSKKRGRDSQINQFLTDVKDKQALAAIKTNEQRRDATRESLEMAVRALQGQGKKITQRAIQELSGVSLITVKRYWKTLKK